MSALGSVNKCAAVPVITPRIPMAFAGPIDLLSLLMLNGVIKCSYWPVVGLIVPSHIGNSLHGGNLYAAANNVFILKLRTRGSNFILASFCLRHALSNTLVGYAASCEDISPKLAGE